jgi:ribosome-associated protein
LVATAVELRFDIQHSSALPEPVRERLLKKADRRITDEGVLIISAQRFRTQERNREDARERLIALVQSALQVAKPRVATKPSRSAVKKRLEQKRGRAEIKRTRSKKHWD